MKQASLLASAAFAAFTTATSAQEITTIDNPNYAKAVADYITQNCPTTEAKDPQKVAVCIGAGATMSVTIATDMSKYIADNANQLGPFWTLAADNIFVSCLAPMDRLSALGTLAIDDYRERAFEAVKGCEKSMVRAGDSVSIDFEPTARNTVSCHLNRLKGHACEPFLRN